MKNKIYALSILAIGFSATSFGQSTAEASATAVLVTPISVSKITDLNFGIVASSGTNGTVQMDYANGRTATGGASLPAGSTAQTTAVFEVTGEANNGFSISIPESIILTGSVSGSLTVNNITCDAGASSTLSDQGTATIKVKADLVVPANTVSGTYSNDTDLAVTVNYN